MSEPTVDIGRTAVLVVDMQNDFVEEGTQLQFPAGRNVLPLVQKVLEAARDCGMRLIYTAHVHRRGGVDMGFHRELYPPVAAGEALVDGERGGDVHPDLAPRAGELLIKKRRYNSFYVTDLEIVLRGSASRRSLLLLQGLCRVHGDQPARLNRHDVRAAR